MCKNDFENVVVTVFVDEEKRSGKKCLNRLNREKVRRTGEGQNFKWSK